MRLAPVFGGVALASMLVSARPASTNFAGPAARALPLDSSSLNATFDYVIVGGGTAGLVVAQRLGKLNNVSVAVIEAGPSGQGNPGISIPGLYGTVFMSNLDWNYTTVPQAALNNRSVYQPRGRILGGSSSVNGLAHTRPKVSELDAWERLGNPGWNWENIFKYSKQAENFRCPPADVQAEYGIGCVPEDHGTSGPYENTYTNFRYPQEKLWLPTANNAGLRNVTGLDGLGGNQVGAGFFPAALNHTNQFRVDTESAFPPGPSVSVIANTTASKVLFSQRGSLQAPIATGVQVTGSDGVSYAVQAKKEVILSAGSFNTPKLLELSGIGSKQVLDKFGIPVLVENDNVGENLHDHTSIPVTFKIQDKFPTYSTVLAKPGQLNLSTAEFLANQTGLLDYVANALGWIPGQFYLDSAKNSSRNLLGSETQQVLDNVTALIKANTHNRKSSSLRPGLLKQWELQAKHFTEWPQTELYWTDAYVGSSLAPPDNSTYVTFIMINLHPFSRGNVHINSSDPVAPPAIDQAYFQEPVDAYLASLGAAAGRKFAQTKPLADIVLEETAPGFTLVPQDAGLAPWLNFSRSVAVTTYHPVGTAAMLPKSKGGVVDPSLRVYGTKNLRIVDASVIPLLPATHLVSTILGIAGRAADMIAADFNHSH